MAEPSAKDRENIDRLLQSGDSRDAAKMMTLIEISTQLGRIAGALETNDAHLASIAESLTQLANPPKPEPEVTLESMESDVRKLGGFPPKTTTELDIECERCGLYPSTVSHRAGCSA